MRLVRPVREALRLEAKAAVAAVARAAETGRGDVQKMAAVELQAGLGRP
jgi:hypothetical protein